MADKLPRSITGMEFRSDGHIYYVVAGDGSRRIAMGLVFLDRYEDLNHHNGEPGLFFVRDAAAKTTTINGQDFIQNGDPTVHEGWAMYTWDTEKTTAKAGWRKVAEQESVDGPWGIDERILKQLVKKVDFNLHIEQSETRFSKIEIRVQGIEGSLAGINTSIEDLLRNMHNHANKAALDRINVVNGQLTFDGRVISGSHILYDNVDYTDGTIVWIDPTVENTEPVKFTNSSKVADEFAKTTLAANGTVLEVVEVDGGVSRYLISKVHGNSSAIFISTTVPNGYGAITYVNTLPSTNLQCYENRGLFCPLADDGTHAPNKLYYYSSLAGWVALDTINGKGPITATGAVCTQCITNGNPGIPYKKNLLLWNDPEPVEVDGIKHVCAKTTIVRKYGSAPTSIDDGQVVAVITDSNVGRTGYVDTCPYSTEPVFYQLFSESRVGGQYTVAEPNGYEPKALDWKSFVALSESDVFSTIVKVGDEIILPEHPVFGYIICEVASNDSDEIIVVSKHALTKMKFGSTNELGNSDVKQWLDRCFDGYTEYVPTEDGRVVEGKEYYYYEDGYIKLDTVVGDPLPEGITCYEKNSEFPLGIVQAFDLPDANASYFDNLTKDKKLPRAKELIDWWTKTTDGEGLKTGNGNVATVDSELGVAVAFTLFIVK